MALAIHDVVVGLDPAIEVAPKKFYVAYKTAQNIACMEVREKKITLYLKLDPKRVTMPKDLARCL